ncbi:GNAT family N-acetyltransferase [Hymenobacter glacieicola]|uniref:Spermidine/spermine N(1)-acetyltransferase n=1 Tax=Hymenobacter glacieicola TaxID=1562124 RepID=A0ABQ1WI87_9BACT|nr:GNAT family N-acetyltransferase [Hymenobacter glacieicola]GGG29246.1 spermidine/spermine N(1)-acetyltransferase [Hymenobacter glacieicola]
MTSPLRILVAKRNAATAAQLAELGQRLFHETYAAQNAPEDMAAYEAATFSPEKQLSELQDSNTVFLLAQLVQEVVGYAKLKLHSTLGLDPDKTPEDRLEVERLYVSQDWIGTGLGAALMRRAIEEARQQGSRAVVLGVWEKNARALEFYRRFGFKQVGTHPFTVGSDEQTDLILRKGLQ